MSIGIAIAVPDGIALAADTQTTWNQTVAKAKEKTTGREVELADPLQIPVGWSQKARKLFSVDISGRKFAVVTAGVTHLNSKSMFAVFRSGAHNYQGNPSYADVAKHFVDHLRSELASHFSCSISDLSKKPVAACDFILAGYDDNDVAKPVVESHIVFSGVATANGKQDASGHIVRWSNLSQPSRYGGCWIGQVAYISHVVNHSNPDLPPISGQYAMMTLADAVDYTKFLVTFTCDFQRFAIMVPNCGRPIKSATLTPEEYQEAVID